MLQFGVLAFFGFRLRFDGFAFLCCRVLRLLMKAQRSCQISWWTFSRRIWIFCWESLTLRDYLRSRILFNEDIKRNHINNFIYFDSLIPRIWQIFRRRFTSRERWERECICIGEIRGILKSLYKNVYFVFSKLISIRSNCLFLKKEIQSFYGYVLLGTMETYTSLSYYYLG